MELIKYVEIVDSIDYCYTLTLDNKSPVDTMPKPARKNGITICTNLAFIVSSFFDLIISTLVILLTSAALTFKIKLFKILIQV
jgi:hypothetical protein